MLHKRNSVNKVSFLFLALLVLFLISFFKSNHNFQAKFIFFYSKDCPHAKKMQEYFPYLEKKFNIEIEKLEFSYNLTNMELMVSYYPVIEESCKIFNVPVFLSVKTNSSMCGEKDLEEMEEFIKANM